MPNHITNIIKTTPSVLAALKKGDTLVDFNALIEMPPGLHETTSEGHATSLAELLTGGINLTSRPTDILQGLKASNAINSITRDGGIKGFRDDESFENFIQMLRNYRAHGAFTWYEWAPEHWGTKWNAYEIKAVEGGIQFDTAWSAPHPVVLALASKFPEERIEHLWADEDIGSNLGHRVYKGGCPFDLTIPDPIDFALTLKGRDREYYRKNEETSLWEYYDPDDEVNSVLNEPSSSNT